MIHEEFDDMANDFLKKANATIKIDFVGRAVNKDWKENVKRNLYEITLTSSKGSMLFDFWDSIRNTEITAMTHEEYAEKRYKCKFDYLTASDKVKTKKELKEKKAKAVPTAYDVLACLTKYDPGTFENFCSEYGYDEDSRPAERIYFAVQKEYSQLAALFTAEQMKEMREIE